MNRADRRKIKKLDPTTYELETAKAKSYNKGFNDGKNVAHTFLGELFEEAINRTNGIGPQRTAELQQHMKDILKEKGLYNGV